MGIEVSVGTVVVIMPNPGVTVAVATGASVGVGVSDGTGVSVGVKVAVGATGFRVKSAGSIMPARACAVELTIWISVLSIRSTVGSLSTVDTEVKLN